MSPSYPAGTRLSILFLPLLLCFATASHAYLSVVRQGAESADSPETGDHFGATVCAGDFNGDGYDDLATAAPDESNGLINNAVHGMVIINPGTSRGIGHLNPQVIDVGDLGTAAARFGRSLVAADFDKDGYDDLAVGIPQLNSASGTDRGAVWIYRGSPSGLQGTPYRQIAYDDVEVAPEEFANFGWALTSGDFNDDTYPDLCTSAIGQNSNTGVLYFFYGSAGSGITTTGFDKLFPYTTGGSEAAGGQFGWALASGQLDNVGGDDLVVGAPSTNVLGQAGSGRVYFFYAGASGITATNGWFADNSNLGSHSTAGNASLGFSLAVGHMFQVSDPVDVAVGAPKDDYYSHGDAGSVLLFEFDTQPHAYDSVYKVRQYAPYDATNPDDGDQFGYSLAVGRFDIGNYEDLAIGAPFEDVTEQYVLGAQANAGIFHILYGAPGGPDIFDSETHDATDLNNFVDSGTELGYSLAFGHFDASSREGLAIGAPNADYDSYDGGTDVQDAGQVHIFAPWRQPQGRPHRSSVALDCNGYVVYAQRPFQRVRPASTTKTITLALSCDAIFNGDVDQNHFYQVPQWVDDGPGGSLTPLVAGEKLSFLGLMQTMITVSGNDSAMFLGAILSGDGGPWEGWSGTSPAFATMMNAKTAQYGLSSSTHMTNAAGIDSGDHYVTALDWAVMGRAAITHDCVKTITTAPSWIVERIQPLGSSLGFFAVPGDGGGSNEIHIFEKFVPGWVLSVKSRYPSAVGIKPGSTPGGWNTGVAAGDPYGNGYSSAADFGSRIKDEPVEGVESGSSSGLTADLLAVAETFCDDGGPDDSFLPPPDPGPQPWGTLTGIPPCPDQGPHGLTVHLGEEQILEPQRTVQIDLMRHTFIDPSIPVRQMVRRTQTLHLGTAPISWSVSSAFPQVNQGMEVKNVGDSSVFFEVTWGGVISTASLAPGEVLKIAGSTTPTTNFNAMILPITADGMDLEMTELGYEFSFSLGDGTAAPDMHSIQLTHIPEVDDEVLTAYVRGVDDNCGGDTLDLVVRSDGGVPTAIGDPLPVVPTSMQLLPASPNPFNPRTTLRFDLSRPSNVDLRIFDLRGRLVTTLLDNSPYTAGRHEFVWDGTDDTGVQAASGVYIVRMLSGGEQHTGRVTLIK